MSQAPALKVASLAEGRDGRLIVVSPELDRYLPAPAAYPTLQSALDEWSAAAPLLGVAYEGLATHADRGERLDPGRLHSPLPRAFQWIDTSTYLTHLRRIRAARGMAFPRDLSRIVMYQSGSDANLAPRSSTDLVDESFGLDFEATVAIVTDDVPRGTTVGEAPAHVALLMLTNDLTFRHLMPLDYATGVGPYQAKPARPYAPVALTPAAAGADWDGRLLHSRITVEYNGDVLGTLASESDCVFGFDEILSFAAHTRGLAAGTIIGSGTVSNADPTNGFGCLAERAAVEGDFARAEYMKAGDAVRLEAFSVDGRSLFGAIETSVSGPLPT